MSSVQHERVTVQGIDAISKAHPIERERKIGRELSEKEMEEFASHKEGESKSLEYPLLSSQTRRKIRIY